MTRVAPLVAALLLIGVVTAPAVAVVAQPGAGASEEGASEVGASEVEASEVEAPEAEASEAAAPLGGGPVLVVLDASGSMRADDGTGRSRAEAARSALRELIDGLPDDAVVGLRAYGHRLPNTDPVAGCTDTELLVPVAAGTADALRAAVDGLQPSGFTPIGASLRAAAEDLPDVEGRTVVLVSDGIDTCAPPEACAVARDLAADGVALRVEAIGFQVDEAAAAELRCIADATGGTYRPADDAAALAAELRAEVVGGTPVRGGRSAAEATPLGPGTYRDVLGHPDPRWYAVELAEGQALTVTATLPARPADPALDAAVELLLGQVDVIGVTTCAEDRARGLGPTGHRLVVEGLPIRAGAVCADPGRYVLGLHVPPPEDADRDLEAALAALAVPVQIDVEVVGTPAATPTPPPAAGPAPAPQAPAPTPSEGTPTSAYLLTAAGFAALGGVLGVGASRRMGP